MLNREELLHLIKEKQLVSAYIDLETQLTPNGFDLTVAQVHGFIGSGSLDFSNKERVLPQTEELKPVKASPADSHGWWSLPRGAYKVVTNETVQLPKDVIGIACPRSSLLRMGAFTQTGVWDAGFKGRSEFVLIVENPAGIRLKENCRVVQLVFTHINETAVGYNGMYQEK